MMRYYFSLFFIALLCSRAGAQQITLWQQSITDSPGPRGAIHTGKNGNITNVTQPVLILRKPAHPNGIAILVISGGGYAHIEEGNESGPAADWLASQGITAFELIYRLPGEGWASSNVPFEDGQRAMRLIRSMAKSYQIDPKRIGVMGFSAGAHLAGMLATQPDTDWYPPTDKIDRYAARPDFAALLYPVITMMPPYNHTHSYKMIVGDRKDLRTLYSVELHVTRKTPPMFLAQAEDDPISPVQNSKMMYAALQQKNIPAALHIFPTGGHGWGMWKPGTETVKWPQLFGDWLRQY